MKYLTLVFLFIANISYAKIDIKPGLWKVDMTVTDASGKETNLNKKMEEAMAQIPAAQREQMKKMMEKKGGIMASDPARVCYSEEMIKNPKSMANYDDDKKCDTKILSQTRTKMTAKFTCEDGTKGKYNFVAKDRKTYEGNIQATTPEGKETQMKYLGTFISPDCGDVKPLKI